MQKTCSKKVVALMLFLQVSLITVVIAAFTLQFANLSYFNNNYIFASALVILSLSLFGISLKSCISHHNYIKIPNK